MGYVLPKTHKLCLPSVKASGEPMQRVEGRHIIAGEGKSVLAISQFSHNLSVSL